MDTRTGALKANGHSGVHDKKEKKEKGGQQQTRKQGRAKRKKH